MTRTQTRNFAYRRKRTPLLIAAAALLTSVVIAHHFFARSLVTLDPSVSIERAQGGDSSILNGARNSIDLPDDGEVYRTAYRLREASGLALAAALDAASQQMNRRFASDANALIAGIQSAGLLPQGVTPQRCALLLSDRSKLLLRYRPEPLMIEVLSFPRSYENGPALMIRIPSIGDDAEHGSVFIADRLDHVDTPPPFASLTDCVRAGWIDQSLNLQEMSEAQLQQLQHWLKSRRSH